MARLLRAAGLHGVRRGKRFVTTRPDEAATRPPDRVQRDFTATAPNRLWIVDFTYVPTWAGTVFTAFVSDVFSRRIVGWRTAGFDADRAAAGRVGDGAVDQGPRRS